METDDNEVEAFEEGDSDCLFQAGGYRRLFAAQFKGAFFIQRQCGRVLESL